MKFTIRQGTLEDGEAFIRLIYSVQSEMTQKEWFYLDPPDETRRQLQKGMVKLWLAEDGDTLAGVLSIVIPGKDPLNYGYDLVFPEEDLMKVVNMDVAAVAPEYRGYGLQGKLLKTAEEALRREGQHILLCTIHPDNRYSLQNACNNGYAIQLQLEKYGSVRYILRKDI